MSRAVLFFATCLFSWLFFFFFQAEDGIRDHCVTGVQTCALPISSTQQQLGDWGITHPGDVQLLAGDLMSQFCLQCQFDTFKPTDAQVDFRGNAIALYKAFAAAYLVDSDPFTPGNQPGNPINLTNN